MALFFFLTLDCALRARRSMARRVGWEAAAVLSCALAMSSKETAVTLPLVVLLYDRAFASDSSPRRCGRGSACTAVSRRHGSCLPASSGARHARTVSLTAVSPWTYLLNQVQLVVRYLWLTVGCGRWCSTTGSRVRSRSRRWPRPPCCWPHSAWPHSSPTSGGPDRLPTPVAFFLTLAPSSSIVPVVTEVGAERRMYVPMAALAVLAVVLGAGVLEHLRAGQPRHARGMTRAVVGLYAVAIAALGVRTMYRNAEYTTPLRLWQTVVERWPQGRARYSVGTALIAAGRHDEGMAELAAAVPDFPDARYALGTELVAEGRYGDAIAQLTPFIARAPERADRLPARLLLGHALAGEGKPDAAVEAFRQVLAVDPSNQDALATIAAVGAEHRRRAAALLGGQHLAEAADEARAALRVSAQDTAAHESARRRPGVRGSSSTRPSPSSVGRCRFDPNDAQARDNLARALGLTSSGHR